MKRYQKLAVGLSLSVVLCGYTYAAAADAPARAAGAVPAVTETAEADALTYSYESTQYGYHIMCPQKPVGVIPASALYDDREGMRGQCSLMHSLMHLCQILMTLSRRRL